MKKTILVVDDERNIRDLIQFRLEQVGYQVICAADGKEALEKIASVRPDAVVLDLMMPGVSGLEVVAQVRAREDLKDIKIMILSAKGQEQDQIAGLAVGADAYLCKPFRAHDLLETVSGLLNV